MTDEIAFYTNPMSRGRTVRWILEEVGIWCLVLAISAGRLRSLSVAIRAGSPCCRVPRAGSLSCSVRASS